MNEQKDCVEEWIEEMKENERLLHELQESKSKERIHKFCLERFSGSSEDIKFYTGFPDYPRLIEFWKYVEPSSCNLTYFSYVHDNSDSINLLIILPVLKENKNSFPEGMFVVEGHYSQLTNFACL